jgi:hypothetical protein
MNSERDLPVFTEGPPIPANDSLGRGCLYGCLCQIAFLALGFIAVFFSNGKVQDALFVGWGVTQWIGLLPLILHHKGKDHPATVQGLLITGALGVLLSSACAAIVFSR